MRDINTESSKKLQSLGAEIVKADMGESKESLTNTLKKYNAAYLVTPGHIDRARLVRNAVLAAKEAKIDYILVVSIPTAGY